MSIVSRPAERDQERRLNRCIVGAPVPCLVVEKRHSRARRKPPSQSKAQLCCGRLALKKSCKGFNRLKIRSAWTGALHQLASLGRYQFLFHLCWPNASSLNPGPQVGQRPVQTSDRAGLLSQDVPPELGSNFSPSNWFPTYNLP